MLPHATSISALATITDALWVCGGNSSVGGGNGGSACYVVDSSGSSDTKFAFSWDSVSSVIYTSSGNIMISGITSTTTSTNSAVAKCTLSEQLTCSVRTYQVTSFVRGSYSEYTNKVLYIGTIGTRTAATIVTTTSTGISSVSYYYSSSVLTFSMLRTASPPHFVGCMIVGTVSTVTANNHILSGWINLDTGSLSAYYISTVTGNIQNSVDLVNNVVVEPTSADSIIVGGIDMGDSVGMCMYIVRTNALYRTVMLL